MASSRERQRKLARAKMERQMARRASRARRNRQIQAGIVAGVALVLVIGGGLWLGGVFSHKAKSAGPATVYDCSWNKADTAANKNLKDVGMPPDLGIPKTGVETMTITTNLGVISANLDLAKAPCSSASFRYLASKHFFDKTSCHRLLDSGDYVLQCGDPTGTGSGGPGYTFPDETRPPPPSADPKLPPDSSQTVLYPAGSLAMANSGPNTNGSQFFIVYKDSQFKPDYTIFGHVTSGLDIVAQVGAAGDDGAFADQSGGGHPKKAVNIATLTVSDPTEAPAPAPSTSGSASPTAPTAPSPGPSGSPAPKS